MIPTLRRLLTPLGLIFAAFPLTVLFLWLASGRETLTKSFRAVEIEVANDMFGDSTLQTELVSGPLLGYFVGLDAVAAAVTLSAVCFVGLALVQRIQRRQRVVVLGE